jgi:hypothetical protein
LAWGRCLTAREREAAGEGSGGRAGGKGEVQEGGGLSRAAEAEAERVGSQPRARVGCAHSQVAHSHIHTCL